MRIAPLKCKDAWQGSAQVGCGWEGALFSWWWVCRALPRSPNQNTHLIRTQALVLPIPWHFRAHSNKLVSRRTVLSKKDLTQVSPPSSFEYGPISMSDHLWRVECSRVLPFCFVLGQLCCAVSAAEFPGGGGDGDLKSPLWLHCT